MAPFNDYFKGKRVFLTGHTGFKGAWMALWLKALGAEVTGYSLEAPSTPSVFESVGLSRRIRHIHGDIRDAAGLGKAMADARPQVVFHLAAQALVLGSYSQPVETLQTNVIGSANVMEAVRATGSVESLVLVTTDKCYENREQPWGYRENDSLGGHDPYSASKGAMEIVCASWNNSFFIPEGRVGVATVRAGNVIGGGDFGVNRLVPDYVRAVLDDRELEVRMPGAIRPWQFVLEPLSGYMWLAAMLGSDPKRYRGAWNFAPGDNTCTVRELVDAVGRISGVGAWKDCSAGHEGPHEASILKLCVDKAAAILKWKAILDIDQTVEMTMRGYAPFIEGHPERLAEVCERQCDEYERLAAAEGLAWAR